jgi:hypothetical protein
LTTKRNSASWNSANPRLYRKLLSFVLVPVSSGQLRLIYADHIEAQGARVFEFVC